MDKPAAPVRPDPVALAHARADLASLDRHAALLALIRPQLVRRIAALVKAAQRASLQ